METYKLFQMGMSYAQSLLAFHTTGTPRPFSAAFAVTNKCNLKCVYCEYPNIKTPELNLEQIELLFKKLWKMGVVRLGMLGGEPLVRKDFGEIIALAKKTGFFVSVNTNLLLYTRFKDNLDKVDYYFTSLDGTPEKHIANRGKQNYDVIVEAIRDIVERGKKITAICVVTEPDKASADYLIDLAVRENINVHFQQECYDAKHAGRKAPQSAEQKQIRDFWLYLSERKKQGAPITSSNGYINYIMQWDDYRVNAVYDSQQKCAAGRGFLFIDPSGHAYPCPYVQGDLEGVNLLQDEWAEKFTPPPCSKCIVGPMLEFNLLFNKPVSSTMAALSKIC